MLILAICSLAHTGCSIIINTGGSDANAHSDTVGTVWHGTNVEMTPIFSDHYTGQLRVYSADGRSRPDGQGTYTYADGQIWEGTWKNGEKDGHMMVSGPHGTQLDIEYRDGKKIRGEGTCVYKDKTKQIGKWDNVLQRGSGTIDFPDGRHYQGEWRTIPGAPDLPDGQGTMTWPDGKTYTGTLRDGIPHGFGKMTQPNGTISDGWWQNGNFIKPATPP